VASIRYAEEANFLPANYSRDFHPWTSDAYEGTLDVRIYITIVSISRIDEDTSVTGCRP